MGNSSSLIRVILSFVVQLLWLRLAVLGPLRLNLNSCIYENSEALAAEGGSPALPCRAVRGSRFQGRAAALPYHEDKGFCRAASAGSFIVYKWRRMK
jgi:hypothetical protein